VQVPDNRPSKDIRVEDSIGMPEGRVRPYVRWGVLKQTPHTDHLECPAIHCHNPPLCLFQNPVCSIWAGLTTRNPNMSYSGNQHHRDEGSLSQPNTPERPPYPAEISAPEPPSDQTPDQSWQGALYERFFVLAPLKAFGTMFFMVLFFMAYLKLLHDPVFAVTTMPLTPVDHWIVFEPSSLMLYLSLWVYVSLPPALLPNRQILVGYGLAIAGLCAIGLLIFLFFPTAVPTPHIDWAKYPDFHLLKGVDGTGNACPSLHVATAAFSGIWLSRLLRDMRCPGYFQIINTLWCLAIIYSTMATKQHVFLDVVAGGLLGIIMALLSLAWLQPNNQKRALIE